MHLVTLDHTGSLGRTTLLALGVLLSCTAAICIGIPIARAIERMPDALIESRVARRRSRLAAFGRQSVWPGRRFMDLLRSTDSARQRREFKSFGLESQLRIPSTESATQFAKLATLLVYLERASAARGSTQLSAIARRAVHELRAYLLLVRLRRGVVVFLLFLIPAALAVANTKLVVGLMPDSALGYDGLVDATLTLALVAGVPVVTYLLGQVLFFLTWTVGHRTESALDDVLLQSVSWLGAAIPGIAVLWLALAHIHEWPSALLTGAQTVIYLFIPTRYSHLPPEVRDLFASSHIGPSGLLVLRASMIAGATVLSIVLLRTLCNRVMREVAERTRQKYDDMMVELARIFGTFILAALGFGWIFMVAFGGSGGVLDQNATGSLMPYAIIVGIAGGVLGIGSRQMLENFFAGVSLQVDRPFEPGERIVLEDGAVCEVRSVGMRSTHFYNISANADLYVPNTRLAQEVVSNLSRPDRQQRRILPIFARDGEDSLRQAEDLVLLAAFTVEGVDVPTILDEAIESGSFQKNRPGVVAEYFKLQEHYDECANAVMRLHGEVQGIGELVSTCARQVSADLARLRGEREQIWDARRGLPHEDLTSSGRADVDELCDTARRIERGMYDLSACFWTLGASYPALRGDLEPLTLEVLRSPTVRSRHVLTSEGASAWELELSVYAHLTEQSDAVLHDLNLVIQQLFVLYGLGPQAVPA